MCNGDKKNQFLRMMTDDGSVTAARSLPFGAARRVLLSACESASSLSTRCVGYGARYRRHGGFSQSSLQPQWAICAGSFVWFCSVFSHASLEKLSLTSLLTLAGIEADDWLRHISAMNKRTNTGKKTKTSVTPPNCLLPGKGSWYIFFRPACAYKDKITRIHHRRWRIYSN